MKRNALVCCFFVAGLSCSLDPVQAQANPAQPSKEIADLLVRWDELNGRCRGGSGDDQKTWDACDEREKMGDQLKSHGWCYGEPGQFGYQMAWHRCKQP
ncbi:MAG: hypothetical protein H7833_05695 [Magnetococcus sp. DMHC-1]|nr:hypothetical protein [Magnetococcales bacterium]